MKERPILFSGEMVRAILDGRKTQTRRVMNPQLKSIDYEVNFVSTKVDALPFPDGKVCLPGGPASSGYPSLAEYCPFGKPGDRLWVRETWYDDLMARSISDGIEGIYYRADGECCEQIPECQCADGGKPKWRPSIFMPRWASRLTLEITRVRVERLQDISEEDAKAEGFEPIIFDEFDIAEIMFNDPDCQEAEVLEILGPGQIPAKADFSLLWDKINGKKHPWASNPWVWVISFKPLCN